MIRDDLLAAGQKALAAREFEAAIEALQAIVDDDEDDAEALLYLGVSYGQIGRFVEAEYYLSMACEREFHWPHAHFNLALVFEKRKLMEEAIRSYENALRADRGYERARQALKRLNVTLSPDLRGDDEPVVPAPPTGAEER